MNYLRIFFIIIYAVPSLLKAQYCDFTYQYDPIIEKNTEGYIKKLDTHFSTRAVVKIPVVIHVVWKNQEENISDAQILSQLEVLNQDFRKKNTDAKDVPASFKTVAADCEFEFCLAQRDSLGKLTTGIMRYQTTVDNIGTTKRVYYTNLGGANGWKPTNYLNIWVCDMDTQLGYCTPLTEALSSPAEDGVVIDYRVFGTIGTAANTQGHKKGRTATHEIGHYFNLLHIWGGNNSCDDDDLIDDTPRQAQAYLGCPSFPQLSCGVGNMYMNFMDYTNDECMGLFTNGQKARMWACLTQYRSGLMNSIANCEPTPTQDIDSQVFIYPNPAQNFIKIDWQNLTTHSKNIIIYDALGRFMYQKKAPNTEGVSEIPLSYFKNGLYFIHLTIEDNKSLLKKVIVSK